MDSTLETIQLIISIVGGIGLFVLGIGYTYGQFISGKRKQASDQTIANTTLIQGLQTQIDAFAAQLQRDRESHRLAVENYNKQIGDLKGEVGRLNGIITEKDKQVNELRQYVGPKLEETLNKILLFMKAYMQEKPLSEFGK